MNSILLPEYASERGFRIYDWLNETLLLRSQGGIFVGGDIDLIFWGVKYIELPLVLHGIRVMKPHNQLALECEQKFAPDQFAEPGERFYVIESEEKRFHVIASNFWIHLNTNHQTASSLPFLVGDDSAKRDFYFSNYVKEWFKLA